MSSAAFTPSLPLLLSPAQRPFASSASSLAARPLPTPSTTRSPSIPKILALTDQNPAEDTPSDTYVPAAEAVSTLLPEDEASKRSELTTRLLYLSAVTSRGQTATTTQRATVDDIVMALEELNPTSSPVETDALDGLWTLVYSSARLFETSPLLLAAATPLLELTQIRQRIALDDGRLITEADVVAFPVTSGTVRTTCRVTPVGGERLELTVETTTVIGGKIADRVDLGGISFDVPIERILSRIKNVTPDTYLDTYYVDEKLRISRSKKGNLYIYTRLD